MAPQENEKKLSLVGAIWDLFKMIELATTVVGVTEDTPSAGLRSLAKANSLGGDEEDPFLKKKMEERKEAGGRRPKPASVCASSLSGKTWHPQRRQWPSRSSLT